MKRSIKNMIEIDGNGFETYSPYRSKCSHCQHFNLIEYNCPAFPVGIPAKFLTGKNTHDRIEKKQVGQTVFTSL